MKHECVRTPSGTCVSGVHLLLFSSSPPPPPPPPPLPLLFLLLLLLPILLLSPLLFSAASADLMLESFGLAFIKLLNSICAYCGWLLVNSMMRKFSIRVTHWDAFKKGRHYFLFLIDDFNTAQFVVNSNGHFFCMHDSLWHSWNDYFWHFGLKTQIIYFHIFTSIFTTFRKY